ncbi:hypothetical protein RAD15_08710 [Bradyrhizobium sp. 14AA]
MLHKLTEEIGRGAAVREAPLKNALPHWRELHGAMVERMRAEALDTNHPLLDWTNMEKSLREIDAQLTQVRLEGTEHVSLEPLPDPDGRSISPRELAEVEQRLVEEYERPLSKIAATPRPNTRPSVKTPATRSSGRMPCPCPIPRRAATIWPRTRAGSIGWARRKRRRRRSHIGKWRIVSTG